MVLLEVKFTLGVPVRKLLQRERPTQIGTPEHPVRQLRLADPVLPDSVSSTVGGWLRLYVDEVFWCDGNGDVYTEHKFKVPFTCSRLVARIEAKGVYEPPKENAPGISGLLLPPSCLRGHVGPNEPRSADSSMPCAVRVKVTSRGLCGFLLKIALPFVRDWAELSAQRAAHSVILRHWFPKGLDHIQVGPEDTQVDSTSFITQEPQIYEVAEKTSVEIREDRQPSAERESSGRFYSGFLHKLGDGVFNTTWNQRFFILDGDQLKYYKTPTEKQPRDRVSVRQALVQRINDKERPFAFVVTPMTHRPLHLSGNTEQETADWVRWIQAAANNTYRDLPPSFPSPNEYDSPAPSPQSKTAQARSISMDSPGPGTGTTAESAPASSPPSDSRRELQQMRFPSKEFSNYSTEKAFRNIMIPLSQDLERCAAQLRLAVSGDSYRLLEVSHGLRVYIRDPASDAQGPLPRGKAIIVLGVATAVLGFLAGLNFFWAIVILAVALLLWSPQINDAPVVCARARLNCPVKVAREALAEPSWFGEWRPGHLAALCLNLTQGPVERVWSAFEQQYFGLRHLISRQRWVHEPDGSWLLCTSAESGHCQGFEGFAVVPTPADTQVTTVVWVCGLDFAPWMPISVRRALAVSRVRALLGLQEFVQSTRAPCWSGSSLNCLENDAQRAVAPRYPGETAYLEVPFRCERAIGGGLCLAGDLGRAGVAATILSGILKAFITGSSKVNADVAPKNRPDLETHLARKFAARWAFAPRFLSLAAAPSIEPRDRLLQVVTFAIAGLHLWAAHHAHFPWEPWISSPKPLTAVLPDGASVQILGQLDSANNARRVSFEVNGPNNAYRIVGADDGRCRHEFPGSFTFPESGVTNIDFPLCQASLSFTSPTLCVVPMGRSPFGYGTQLSWRGNAHFVYPDAGLQCVIQFGLNPHCVDAITGSVCDTQGRELGCISGSWLGPFIYDGEILWRGPRANPPA